MHAILTINLYQGMYKYRECLYNYRWSILLKHSRFMAASIWCFNYLHLRICVIKQIVYSYWLRTYFAKSKNNGIYQLSGSRMRRHSWRVRGPPVSMAWTSRWIRAGLRALRVFPTYLVLHKLLNWHCWGRFRNWNARYYSIDWYKFS